MVGGLLFFSFTIILFFFFSPEGAQGSAAKSKALPQQSVRGYDKKACNKGPLCNLMGLETERGAHLNELRSPCSNLDDGGN